jgi:hypothetical protein
MAADANATTGVDRPLGQSLVRAELRTWELGIE